MLMNVSAYLLKNNWTEDNDPVKNGCFIRVPICSAEVSLKELDSDCLNMDSEEISDIINIVINHVTTNYPDFKIVQWNMEYCDGDYMYSYSFDKSNRVITYKYKYDQKSNSYLKI